MTYLLWAAALVLAVLCVLAHAGLFDDELEEEQRFDAEDDAKWHARAASWRPEPGNMVIGPPWDKRPHSDQADDQPPLQAPASAPTSTPDPKGDRHVTQLWEIRASPGRGLGVFATRPIAQGEIILSERPVFSIAVPRSPAARNGTSGHIKPTPLVSIRDAVEAEFYALSEAQREAYLACHEHCFPMETLEEDLLGKDGLGGGQGGRILRIFRSNAYAFQVAGSGPGVARRIEEWRWGMYLLMARFNHSCCPNVGSNGLDDDVLGDGHKTVRAHRNIAAGEELFVSYVNLLQDTGTRRTGLAQFGFVCGCAACRWSDVSNGWSVADGRRVEAGKLLAELDEVSADPALLDMAFTGRTRCLKKAQRLVDLLQVEGLADYLPHAYRILAGFSHGGSAIAGFQAPRSTRCIKGRGEAHGRLRG